MEILVDSSHPGDYPDRINLFKQAKAYGVVHVRMPRRSALFPGNTFGSDESLAERGEMGLALQQSARVIIPQSKDTVLFRLE
jgi:hypothetical protein